MKLLDSLVYKPVELDFGTSGLRGLVVDMTDLECYINTRGFLAYLQSSSVIRKKSDILIGGDLRDSTPRIICSVIEAVRDMGYNPVFCGYIPTPALANYGQLKNASCIMVTGSHIPSDRNGIKFYKPDGEVLKSDESGIKDCILIERKKIYQIDAQKTAFDIHGMLTGSKSIEVSNDINPDARDQYIKRYTQVFQNEPLKDTRVVFYEHSAVGRDIIPEILRKLGAEVECYGRSKTFVPIDSENVTDEDKSLFIKITKTYPECFALISTDGDSDRPFVIDNEGTFYRGDILGCLSAEYLGLDFVAIPVSSNDAVDKFCTTKAIELVHTKIGSPYVIDAMKQAGEQKNRIGGWEVNGGFLLGSDIRIKDETLQSLPTRDAVLPILMALMSARDKKISIKQLFKSLPPRYTGGGLVDNVPLTSINKFKNSIKVGEFNINIISHLLGVDEKTVVSINTTDGLRVIFDNNDVIHARPSGNAPQVRIYTNCDSQKRADEIVSDAISKNGFLEKLLV